MEEAMNKTQLLSAVLGLLVVVAGALFVNGYTKTWEDYREVITAETNPCFAELAVATGEQLQCKPWLDPDANLTKCIEESSETVQAVIIMKTLMCLIPSGSLLDELIPEGLENVDI